MDVPNDGHSVYQLHFWTDSAIILTGAVITLGANSLMYPLVRQSCPCDPNSVNFIDRPVIANQSKTADIMANYTVGLALVAPVIIDYLDIGYGKSFLEDMTVYSEVLSLNFGLVTVVKFAAQRPYPYVYQKSNVAFETDPSDYLSFYSGHTATTVSSLAAASMTLSLRHKGIVWPWIATAVLGSSVAVELVLSAEHFTTDVVVGAVMGLAVGTLVPGLHARDQNWYHHIFLASSQNQALLGWKTDL